MPESIDYKGLSALVFIQGDPTGKVSYSRNSQDEIKIEANGIRDFCHPQLSLDQDSIIDIGSISKQFTAATMLSLLDDEIAAGMRTNFPHGIDTKISHFLPRLLEKFPECYKFFMRLQADDRITLRDLLNHTHGLGNVDFTVIRDAMLDKTRDLVSLPELVNATNPQGGEYGKYQYGATGYDLAAMIIEVIARQEFDAVMRKQIFERCGLRNTYAPSEVKSLYENNANIARGFFIEGFNQENADLILSEPVDFNVKSVTRAASCVKSCAADLAIFAQNYMGAEMFKSSEVRDIVLQRNKAAEAYGSTSYHFAIERNSQSELVGHHGGTNISQADLRYNPKTGEVIFYAEPLENISRNFAIYVLQQVAQPQDFLQFMKLIEDARSDMKSAVENNPQGYKMFEFYKEIRREILSYNREDLLNAEKKDQVIGDLKTKASKIVQPDSPSPTIGYVAANKMVDLSQTPTLAQ